ncbi:MAG: sulfite exporter TauE/SafE family protein [Coxiellaceae bacterium]|nr:MAG: sulfite exporter TauE/SafE family protein [Coxiellaceae bacterium]
MFYCNWHHCRIFAGLLGIGGGIIVVPALAYVFHWQGIPYDIIMQMAAGTSLAAMILSGAVAAYSHKRHGIELWPIYRLLAPGMILGTIAGAMLASLMDTRWLAVIFALLLLVTGLQMLTQTKPEGHRKLPKFWGLSFMGFLIGANSGLLGLGGGILVVPFLIYSNIPIRNALGISSLVTFTVAIVGTLSFIYTGLHVSQVPGSTGYIYWPAVLGIVAVSPIFAVLGVRLSHYLPVIFLERIFAVFLLLIGIKMLL